MIVLAFVFIISRCSSFTNSQFDSCVKTFRSTDAKSGEFSSPNYPGVYPANQRCSYRFRSFAGEVVIINWTSFHLEEPLSRNNQCLRDFVEVIVIDSQKLQHSSGRFCGSRIPPAFNTLQNHVIIEFRSSFTSHATGFLGNFRFIDEKLVPGPSGYYHDPDPILKEQCGGRTEDGQKDGIIVSPGYPFTHPKNVSCNWLIRVDRGKKIYIRLLELNLSPNLAECDHASLYLTDGYIHKLIQINREIENVDEFSEIKFCGTEAYYRNEGQKSYISHQNRIIVTFVAEQYPTKVQIDEQKATGQSIGFKLIWTEVSTMLRRASGVDSCSQFVCSGGDYCIDDGNNVCGVEKGLCIDKSLVCNGRDNCAQNDYSDEHNCYSTHIVIVVALAGLLLLLTIVSIAIQQWCCSERRKKANRKQKQQQKTKINTDDTMQIASTDVEMPLTAMPTNYHGWKADESFLNANHVWEMEKPKTFPMKKLTTFGKDSDRSLDSFNSDVWERNPCSSLSIVRPPEVRLLHVDKNPTIQLHGSSAFVEPDTLRLSVPPPIVSKSNLPPSYEHLKQLTSISSIKNGRGKSVGFTDHKSDGRELNDGEEEQDESPWRSLKSVIV